MSEDPGFSELSPKEYGSLTLKAGRMYHLCQEREIEDLWNLIVLAICAFEGMHTKEAWEFVLLNRRDVEDIAGVFERSNTPDEFREKLTELKEREMTQRLRLGEH